MLAPSQLRCTAFLACLACALLASGAALSQDVGKKIVTEGGSNGATACVACHGEDGAGNAAANYPRLSELTAAYMVRQLEAYRNGSRSSPIMAPIAAALTAEESQAVSEYYARQDAPVKATTDDAELLARGRHLALEGDWDNEIPSCVSCHGPGGKGLGGAHFPALAGQHAGYITSQIQAWQNDERSNDADRLMQAISARLSEEQVQAVAAYFANLPVLDEQAVAAAGARLAQQRAQQADETAESGEYFTPPDEATIPDDDFGAMVRLGKQIFVDTQNHAGEFVGNAQNCVDCHINAGRKAGSSPMWAAWGMYPAYRAKNDRVNTMIDRIQGCFRFSMNGTPPPADSDVMTALLSYTYWLSQGAPIGESLPGRGYPELSAPDKEPSYDRGEKIYAKSCAVCHSEDGRGKSVDGQSVFPPLWGSGAYNWGAGMHRIQTAAEFIHANMPLGRGGELLSEQEAWDVAAFINKHPRPQDPRNEGDMGATAEKFHNHACYYNDFEGSIASDMVDD